MINNLAIIEDEEISAFITKKIIEMDRRTKQIHIFKNGETAIDYFKTYASEAQLLPEVIFLDLNMPVMNGWQFIEAYQKIFYKFAKKLEIYILSSSITIAEINKIKEIKVISGHIIKPITKQLFAELAKKHFKS